MTTFRQKFGTTFRQIRKSKNLNQDEVAEKAGLSTSYISDVERGVANPKLDTIDALAKGLEVNAIELFEFSSRSMSAHEIKKLFYELLSETGDENIELLYQKILNLFSKFKG